MSAPPPYAPKQAGYQQVPQGYQQVPQGYQQGPPPITNAPGTGYMPGKFFLILFISSNSGN